MNNEEKNMTTFHGVMPPIPTPFNQDYSVNEEALRTLIEHLIDGGVHAIIPLGSTGEFAKLSMDERKRVLESSIDQVAGRIPVIAGTAAVGTWEVVELSQHAESVGAEGVQVVAPFYGKVNEDEIFDHYRRISESVGIPVLIYNNPITSGVDISPDLLARLSELPHIDGVKEATGDSRRIRQIISLAGDTLSVFVGTDDNVLEAFALGAQGWVSGMANLIPGRCVALYEAAAVQNDIKTARALYYEMGAFCDIIESDAFVQNIKAGLEILGIEAGPPRPPFLPVSDADREQIKSILGQLA
jgi:4-hydroxy-tetrahydrodipicolinate synthase